MLARRVLFLLLFELAAEPHHVLGENVGLLLQFVSLGSHVPQLDLELLYQALMIGKALFCGNLRIPGTGGVGACAVEIGRPTRPLGSQRGFVLL